VRTLLTLDYEVFFGPRTGSVERCLLEPVAALAALAERHRAQLVFFVDAGFLLRMRAEIGRTPQLRADHDAVCRQVEALARAGHEIQLHIHPHWEDARFEGGAWQVGLEHYALQSFPPARIAEIVREYAGVLRELAGDASAFAYRAGGWLVRPFEPIRPALLANDVRIDSTVFAGGRRGGAVQSFDFRAAPAKSRWHFDRDPLREASGGPFLEVPIASCRVGPLFFWKLAAAKKLGGARHRTFGDGEPIALDRGDLASKLLAPSTSVVSLDGYKAACLAAEFDRYRARGLEDFVVIGHPKALTPFGLARLAEFLSSRRPHIATYAAYRDEIAPARDALVAA